jgi:hypothetical protein
MYTNTSDKHIKYLCKKNPEEKIVQASQAKL